MHSLIVIVLGGIVVLYFLAMEVIDMAGRIDYVESRWPRLIRWAERKAWHRVLLLVGVLLLAGNIYEIYRERPDESISPLRVPDTRDAEITQLRQKIKELEQTKQKVIVKTVQPQDMPSRITVKEYGGWKLNSGTKSGTAYFVLGMTNKTITPVRVTMTCDQDFFKFDPGVLIARGEHDVVIRELEVRQVDNRTYEYFAESPPWTPELPLGFGVFTESTKGIACKIYQNP